MFFKYFIEKKALNFFIFIIIDFNCRGLYAAVPGLRKCLLGFRAKRFGEQYHHLQQRRRVSSKGSLRDSTDSLGAYLNSVTNLNGHNENNQKDSDGDDDGNLLSNIKHY